MLVFIDLYSTEIRLTFFAKAGETLQVFTYTSRIVLAGRATTRIYANQTAVIAVVFHIALTQTQIRAIFNLYARAIAAKLKIRITR